MSLVKSIYNKLPAIRQTTANSKFESNVERIFAHMPKTSSARLITAAILSPMLILTALLDLVRKAAFKMKLCNGKSYKVIDKAAALSNQLVRKAKSAYASYTKPKELTIGDLSKALQAQVASLVNGYRKLNGTFFEGYGNACTPTARSGERQIARAQKELVQTVHAIMRKGPQKAEEFKPFLEAVKAGIKNTIDKA